MITGTELKQLTDQGKQPKVIVAHNHGTVYGALVIIDSPTLPKAICDPGSGEVLQFNSLDQVASFYHRSASRHSRLQFEGLNMGQAKRRAALKDHVSTYNFAAVASAVRRLSVAASSHLGSDCYMLSALAQELLKRDGVFAQLRAGYAGWRCGSGDSDVILHCPTDSIPPQNGVVYHVWLEIVDHIFDVTTFSLPQKARELDLLDGGSTTVDWHPDYLFVPKSTVSSVRDVVQKHAGLYFYERQSQVEQLIFGVAPDLDPDDVDAALTLYQHQDMVVLGPNNINLRGT